MKIKVTQTIDVPRSFYCENCLRKEQDNKGQWFCGIYNRMREILFRGKRIDNGEWVVGGYRHEKVGEYLTAVFVIEPLTDGVWEHHRVDPATVGQYTGLTDKNGKRIFEGDICRFREWSKGEMCWIGKVHWEHQQFVISGGRNKECEGTFELRMSRFISKDIEVIGNIHDNRLEDFDGG